MPREIRSLTGLRGLAAVAVVIFHEAGDVTATGPAENLLRHGYNAVDLFFVLSGFVMALNYGPSLTDRLSLPSYRDFLLKRLARIYPVYLVITVLTLLIFQLGLSHIGPVEQPMLTFLLNVFLVQSWGLAQSIVGPAWSISTEWAAYLACPVLMLLALHPRARRPIGLLAVSLLALVGLSYAPDAYVIGDQTARMGQLDLYGVGTVSPLIRCLASFSIGLLAFRWRDRVGAAFCAPVVCVTAVALCFPGTDVLLVGLFMLLVMSLSEDRGAVARILGHKFAYGLGILSYSVYLLHPRFNPVKAALQRVLERHGMPFATSIGIGLTIVVILLCAAVAYFLVEKPGRNLVRGALQFRTTRPVEQEPSAP